MGKHIAFGIEDAAKASGVQKRTIVAALKARQLKARAVEGEPIILVTDLKAWAKTLPEFYSSRD